VAGEPAGVGGDRLDDVDEHAVGVGDHHVALPERLVPQRQHHPDAGRPQPGVDCGGVGDQQPNDQVLGAAAPVAVGTVSWSARTKASS
jgi:hypothetical protein